MNEKVDKMIDDIIRREGEYVDHPNDRGGPTKYGITQKTLSQYLGYAAVKSDVQNLDIEVARAIYEKNYYMAPGIYKLPEPIQAFIFDSAVNHGPRRALKFVQSVCNQAGVEPATSVDGAMGPNTLRAVNWTNEQMGDVFLTALIEERRNYYLLIVANNPSQEVFLRGWMNRVNEFDTEVA